MGLSSAQIETIFAVALGAAFIYLSVQKVPRTNGTNLKNHIIFAVITAGIIIVLPLDVRILVFSPLGVRIVASLYPLFESIRAVCTPDGEDDTTWLQYWITYSIVFYTSEWIEDFTDDNPTLYLFFYHFEFFFYLWLLLPHTDGAALIFNAITEPLLAPLIEPLAKTVESWISMVISTAVSATHLWIVWAVFLFFPPALKRFITVSVGTIYPLLASIVAVTTPTKEDDTFWLTYWSCFGSLFLIMDWLDSYLGQVPGFYTAVLFCTIYLMVPVFNGAEKVFRNVLVPLARQHEMLIYRDACIIKKEMMKKVPKGNNKSMRKKIAALFNEHSDDEEDDEEKASLFSKKASDTTYQSIS